MTRLLVPVSGTRQLLQPGLVDRSPPAQNRRLARLLDRHPQLRPGTAHADRRLPQAHQNGKEESGVRRNGKEVKDRTSCRSVSGTSSPRW